jgi:hypothetical protein
MSILEIFWAPWFAPYHNAILHHLNRVILLKDVLCRMCNLDPKKERKMYDAIWNSLSCWNSKEKCLQKNKMKPQLTYLTSGGTFLKMWDQMNSALFGCVCASLPQRVQGAEREREREAEPTNKRNCTTKTWQYGIKWLKLGPSKSLGPNNMRPWPWP